METFKRNDSLNRLSRWPLSDLLERLNRKLLKVLESYARVREKKIQKNRGVKKSDAIVRATRARNHKKDTLSQNARLSQKITIGLYRIKILFSSANRRISCLLIIILFPITVAAIFFFLMRSNTCVNLISNIWETS